MSARESGRAEQPTRAVSAEDHIDPVSPERLGEAAGLGKMTAESARLRDLEWRAYLSKRRSADRREVPERTPEDLTGIALSGGGIRSAIFALGVLQALAGRDLLRRFDYLSTVSGGGYIGASLTWLTSQAALERAGEVAAKNDGPSLPKKGFGLGPSSSDTPFPYGTDDPRTATEPERSRAEGAMLRYLRQHGNYLTPGSGLTFTSIIVVVLRGLVLNLLVWVPIIAAVMAILVVFSSPASPLAPYAAFRVMLMAAAGLLAACVVAFAVYSLTTYGAHTAESASYRWSQRWAGQRYSLRRHFENWMRWPLWVAAALLLLGSPPFIVGKLHGWVAGPAFSLIGVLSGLATFARTMQPRPKRAERSGWSIPSGWIASIGAAFLLYGVLLLSFAIGRSAGLGWNEGAYGPVVALGAGLAVAVVTGIVVDLNLITVHRFYRDRLMEAFLPDVDKALANETAPAGQGDAAALKAMCSPDHPVGPYHIINTNLVLIESDERTYRLRGGDSFMLSPLLCGSNATGWQATDRFMHGELTLPTAMAISGAAANPWTASGGVGVTRSLLVATLMALLNLRLGFWTPNPRDPSCTESYRPNHFHPGLLEVMGLSLQETSKVCLLSDGGHFENLGIYELIRRRVRFILLCDGTADPDYDFADLQIALARIWTDFAARIEFDGGTLGPFLPSEKADYPAGALVSQSAYAVAKITYPDKSEGHLVYLTTALIKGLRLQLMGYKGLNWDFPDQSTGDQFFSETQFEAYRELGFVIAESAMPTIEKLLTHAATAAGSRHAAE